MANPILEHLRLSGTTYDLVDSTAIHSLDGYWDSATTQNAITAATGALAETIDQELSGKADTTAVTQEISAAVSGKADTTAVTQAIDAATSGKADTTAVTQAISEAVSGKLDTSTFATYSGNVDTALASKIAGAAWDSTTSHLNFFDNVSATGTPLTYVDGADWVKDSFLKSVTVEDREISGETVPCLVFVFETQTGEEETVIPLSDIFDPSNYVSTDTFTAYTASTATEIGNKADTTAMTQAISEATSGKADTSTVVTDVRAGETASGFFNLNIYQTKNGAETMVGSFGGFHTDGSDGLIKDGLGVLKVNTNVIQEKLSSGTNIKTVGGNSLLGSGDVPFPPGMTAEVQGTTLIFS